MHAHWQDNPCIQTEEETAVDRRESRDAGADGTGSHSLAFRLTGLLCMILLTVNIFVCRTAAVKADILAGQTKAIASIKELAEKIIPQKTAALLAGQDLYAQMGGCMVDAERTDIRVESLAEQAGNDAVNASLFDTVISERAEAYRAEQARLEAIRQEFAYVENNPKGLGSAGRLFIPSVDLDVSLAASSRFNDDIQALTDMEDCATYFAYENMMVIADHVHQGFWKMKGTAVGARAYIKTADGIQTYVCIANMPGHNTGPTLTDNAYNSISSYNPGGLAMYTCNGGWQNIIITLWQPE